MTQQGQNSSEAIEVGRSIDDVCEAECGGRLHRAIILTELHSSAYTAAEEFAYDDGDFVADLVEKCREIERIVGDLSMTKDGALTLNRECSRCSGAGKSGGEDPCIECGGKGFVHADEADG